MLIIGALHAAALCGCSEGTRLGVEGPTPYARCLARSVDDLAPHKIGRASVSVAGRVLTISGLPGPIRLAAFSGPGPGPEPWGKWGGKPPPELVAAQPSLVLVMGDLGDDPALAAGTAGALDALGVPVLLVGGGRDAPSTLAAAEGLPNVIDVSPMLAVRLIPASKGGAGTPSYSLVPIAGAADGRYARGSDGCGYAEADLEDRGLPEAAPGERRLLAAWHAPLGLDREHGAADAGSPLLAAFAQRARLGAGLFGWPHAQAGRVRSPADGSPRPAGAPTADLGLVVPRLAGVSVERADGSRLAHGFALVELGSPGPLLRELRTIAFP